MPLWSIPIIYASIGASINLFLMTGLWLQITKYDRDRDVWYKYIKLCLYNLLIYMIMWPLQLVFLAMVNSEKFMKWED